MNEGHRIDGIGLSVFVSSELCVGHSLLNPRTEHKSEFDPCGDKIALI